MVISNLGTFVTACFVRNVISQQCGQVKTPIVFGGKGGSTQFFVVDVNPEGIVIGGTTQDIGFSGYSSPTPLLLKYTFDFIFREAKLFKMSVALRET